jgi:hypothetical protein
MNNLTTFALDKTSLLPTMSQAEEHRKPCQYNSDEALRRIAQSTEDAESGNGCLSNAEFQSLVRSWYK